MTGEVASIKPFDDKFSEDSTLQKSLKSVNFSQSYLKNKNVATFLGHSVYISEAGDGGDFRFRFGG